MITGPVTLSIVLALGSPDQIDVIADQETFSITGSDVQAIRNESQEYRTQPAGDRIHVVEYGCGGHGTTQTNCDGLVTSALAVCEGDFIARPRMVYVYNENNVLLSSSFVAGDCSTSPNPITPELVIVSAHDFQRLPLEGSGIEITPDRETYYINLPILTSTDTKPQTLSTTILGTPVIVKATPFAFTWDYSDPASKAQTAGHKATHIYSAPDAYTITLTTEWTGQFSTDNGSTWQPIDGTATTTDISEPLTLKQSTPRLASQQLNEQG